MPIIDFTGAYNDASRGMTLKALQERRAKLQQQAIEAAQPQQIAAPSQGVAQVLGTIGAGLREGRAASQEAAMRDRMAQLVSGGVDASEMGELTAIDPETARFYQTNAWEEAKTRAKEEFDRQQQERLFAHQNEADAAKVEADKAAAAEAARVAAEAAKVGHGYDVETAATGHGYDVETAATKAATDEAAAVSAFEREQGVPQSDTGKINQDYTSGKYGTVGSPEAIAARDAEIRKATYVQPLKPGDMFSPAQRKVEEKFGEGEYDWQTAGGPNAIKAIGDAANAINILDKYKDSPLGVSGIIGYLPENYQKLFNQQGVSARDSIRNVVQMSLRPILGAQFTQQEGEALMNRAFDPTLDERENIRRAKLIVDQAVGIARARQAMSDYYHEKDAAGNERGNIVGYQGPGLDFNTLKTLFTSPEPVADDNTPPPDPEAEKAARKKRYNLE